ncbi:MAG TPA: hypothetical protein VIK78_13595 [Ruminiclostridium sp.]
MVKNTHLLKNKTILIVLAILILCGIIAFIALLSMYSDEAPAKAVYVFENIIL